MNNKQIKGYRERVMVDLEISLKETREESGGLSLRETAKVVKKVFTEEEIEMFIKELKVGL